VAQLQPPAHETYTGKLARIPGYAPAVLLIGRGRLIRQAKLIYSGQIVIYFAFPLFFSTDRLFPQLAVDDFRREYHGAAAIAFMLNKGNSYPRADAIGIRLSTGQRADLFMKEVDIAAGLGAFAFKSDLSGPPVAQVGSVVWLDEAMRPADGVLRLEDDHASLLHLSSRCFTCSPASLATLIELLTDDQEA
jgi:hypothetical protein